MRTAKKYRMASRLPARKVIAGGVVQALGIVIALLLNRHVYAGNPITAEEALAVATVVSVIVMYFVPPAPRDRVIEMEEA